MPFSDEVTAEDRHEIIYSQIEQAFVLWLNEHLDLVPTEFKQRVLDMVDSVHDYDQPDTLYYVNRAVEDYPHEGETEVDSTALVSKGADEGAYVMAWVWVSNEEMPEELLEEAEDA